MSTPSAFPVSFQTVGQAFNPRDNNFDLLRLIAAVLVVVSHSYPLTGKAYEPFANDLGEFDTGGGWGVAIFFVISGFLVTRSVLDRSVSAYFSSRALRIIPALALVTCFEIVLIGPLFTTLSLAEYFSSGAAYSRFVNVLIFARQQGLPGVFADNPVAYQVNGSLWTLPIETAFYILLPALAALGLLKGWRLLAVLCGAVACYLYGTTALEWNWANQGMMLFPNGPAYYVVKQGLFFLIGACFWVYRDRIPLNGYLASACVALLVVFAYREARVAAFYVALPYLTIYLAFGLRFRSHALAKLGDLSYGTYVFAFSIQQSLVAVLGRDASPTFVTLCALPLILFAAFLSWHWVEQPALKLRRLLTHRSAKQAPAHGDTDEPGGPGAVPAT